ncbi:hypothetical protein DEA98_25175 [Brucella pseudogrignonensis]|nr:hypothetical protein [Brucella pseudogrignonensis]
MPCLAAPKAKQRPPAFVPPTADHHWHTSTPLSYASRQKGPHPDIGYAERRSPIGDHHIEEIAVPLFNEASRIYAPDEIDFLRNCVALASLKLSSTQLDETVLAERILRLYESGLRDASTICDLAVRLITPANESTDILAANGNAPHEIDLLPE